MREVGGKTILAADPPPSYAFPSPPSLQPPLGIDHVGRTQRGHGTRAGYGGFEQPPPPPSHEGLMTQHTGKEFHTNTHCHIPN